MLPSMYSGISGLKANQRKLDVIGNNIANSSTTAFKGQTIKFADSISQSISNATGATSSTGGINGRQVGSGVDIAAIDTNTNTGSMQPTNNVTDCAIDGTGYFVVGKAALPADSNSTDNTIAIADDTHTVTSSGVDMSYTRDGSFRTDTQGNLLTADGSRVYGYANTNATIAYNTTDMKAAHTVTASAIPAAMTSTDTLVPLVIPLSISDGNNNLAVSEVTIGTDGTITAQTANGSVVLGQIAMVSFSNEAGLKKIGNNLYKQSENSGNPVARSKYGADSANDNSVGYGDVLSKRLEMSNVDLAEQFTDMIVANRAFQANGKIISTGDEILQDLVNLKR